MPQHKLFPDAKAALDGLVADGVVERRGRSYRLATG